MGKYAITPSYLECLIRSGFQVLSSVAVLLEEQFYADLAKH